MDSRSLALVLIALGVLAIVVGLLVMSGALGWFGRLPGDLRWESGNTRVFFPVTTMIVVSVVLSLLLAAVRRFF